MFNQLNQEKAPNALGLDAMVQQARTNNKMAYLFSHAPVIAWHFCGLPAAYHILKNTTSQLFVSSKDCIVP
jgi:hypothetical protein